ncbi:MAG: hypothetical protein IT294_12255 [Deltaproteobacteria bacterium]|nr:hypothetical protein [Deltaproteobacteria bacterium]
MRATAAAILLGALVLASAAAWADVGAFERCGAGTHERLTFIEDRLEERRPYAQYWWLGWTGFYGLGAAVQSARAATEDDDSMQADFVVSAVKASFGVMRLLVWPPTAKAGAAAMRVVEPRDETACRERLRVGEELLRRNARESESRWDWKRHAANVGINVAGALIVAEGWDDPSRGWRSAGIGTAVGEVFTFSHPWKADDDLAEYEERFAPRADLTPTKVSFEVAPQLGGIALGLRF